MKKLYTLMASLFATACLFNSCSDDEWVENADLVGEGIQFGINLPDSRTVYDSNNTSQINWVSGDKISIYCNEANASKNADYSVTPASQKHQGSITAVGGNFLQWGGMKTHNFYAVYPSGVKVNNGIATFSVNRNQQCVVTTTDGNTQNVVATPDMSNAYMVARKSTAPTETVNLEFKPIMTTLEVVVKGPTTVMNTNEDKGYARVTGISVAITTVSNIVGNRSTFGYDIVNDKYVNPASEDGTGNEKTEQIFIDLVNSSKEKSYVDLASGKTLTLTAFLPPVDKATASLVKQKMRIRVHTTGGDYDNVAPIKTNNASSTSWTTQLTPSVKRVIQLPSIPNAVVSKNNWITPLDGNIYVSQMSIPGSHDAATGDGFATGILGEGARTQSISISQQWDLGVRAFDMRPALWIEPDLNIFKENERLMWLWHATFRTLRSWNVTMNVIIDKLRANPGEFAIVLFRHEDEALAGTKDNDAGKFNTRMTEWVNNNQDYLVDWKPDLTIDECRGKILLISRFEAGNWTKGAYVGWNHDQSGGEVTIRSKANGKTGRLFIQDYYNIQSNYGTKTDAIKAYLQKSAQFHRDPNHKNTWMINHCSGYLLAGTSMGYRVNAQEQNPVITNYLTGNSWEGSTGILMFDYSGARQSGFFEWDVRGDLMLQTTINNNYKYHMLRKGE